MKEFVFEKKVVFWKKMPHRSIFQKHKEYGDVPLDIGGVPFLSLLTKQNEIKANQLYEIFFFLLCWNLKETYLLIANAIDSTTFLTS